MRRARRQTLGATAIALLLASGAAAREPQAIGRGIIRPEAETGHLVPRAPTVATAEQVGQMMKAVGRCSYGAYGRQADRLLAASDTESLTMTSFGFRSNGEEDKFGISRCMAYANNGTEMHTQMQIPPVRLRAILAEEAYLKRHPAPPALPAGAGEDALRAFVSTGSALARARALAAFGDCIVFKDTPGADAMLRTMPGTKAERVAAKALAPALGPCLVAGQEIALTPIAIRAIVADVLWARYAAPVAGVAGR